MSGFVRAPRIRLGFETEGPIRASLNRSRTRSGEAASESCPGTDRAKTAIDGALGSRQAIHALLSNYKKGKKLHLYPSPDEWEVHSPACTLAACVIPSIA